MAPVPVLTPHMSAYRKIISRWRWTGNPAFLRLVAFSARLISHGTLASTSIRSTSRHRLHPHLALVAQTRRIYSNQHRPWTRKEMITQSASHSSTRFICFAAWALLMLTAFLITEAFKPQKAIVVPSVFLVFFVPMVLLPLRTKKN